MNNSNSGRANGSIALLAESQRDPKHSIIRKIYSSVKFSIKLNSAVTVGSIDLVLISIDESSIEEVSYNSPAPPNAETNSLKSDITISKKLIKNGDMGIAVSNINDAKKQVNQILKENKAYTQNEQFRNLETEENLHLIIRVPHQNFDALINSFSNGIGAVEYKNISTDDVTEEYTNVSIKLENKKIYLEKYRNLLKSTSNVKDILEIQENIRALEDEIDVAEGRLRFIDDRVDFSTLELNINKEKPRSSLTSKIGFGSRFSDSMAEGWNNFVGFFLGIMSFWPFLFFIPLLIFAWRKWKQMRKSKKISEEK